jgi:hypothetical protein
MLENRLDLNAPNIKFSSQPEVPAVMSLLFRCTKRARDFYDEVLVIIFIVDRNARAIETSWDGNDDIIKQCSNVRRRHRTVEGLVTVTKLSFEDLRRAEELEAAQHQILTATDQFENDDRSSTPVISSQPDNWILTRLTSRRFRLYRLSMLYLR